MTEGNIKKAVAQGAAVVAGISPLTLIILCWDWFRSLSPWLQAVFMLGALGISGAIFVSGFYLVGVAKRKYNWDVSDAVRELGETVVELKKLYDDLAGTLESVSPPAVVPEDGADTSVPEVRWPAWTGVRYDADAGGEIAVIDEQAWKAAYGDSCTDCIEQIPNGMPWMPCFKGDKNNEMKGVMIDPAAGRLKSLRKNPFGADMPPTNMELYNQMVLSATPLKLLIAWYGERAEDLIADPIKRGNPLFNVAISNTLVQAPELQVRIAVDAFVKITGFTAPGR
ncbi:MAG TPA: hypothetical protein VGJ92_08980 [Methanocella sp.]|jgi:hypothetical protein